MSLKEVKERLIAIMKLPFNERSSLAYSLELRLNEEGFSLCWDDSNEQYCIYALGLSDQE